MPRAVPEIMLVDVPSLRDWLVTHHDTSDGVWLVGWRRDELGPRIHYDDLVSELLCFGWIDSTVRTVDDDRSATRITPRRPGSVWSRPNKVRVAALLGTDRMTAAGMLAIERAQADGSWTFLDDVEDLVVPDDLAAALGAADAREPFEALTAGRRKQLLYWIKSARRPATREARIARTVEAAADGRSALD